MKHLLLLGFLFCFIYSLQAQDNSELELQGILDAFENDKSETVEGKKVDLKSLQFETGTDKLTSTDKQYLDRIIDYFKSLPTAILTIEGHSDNVGNKRDNQSLSEKRAIAVKRYLVEIGASSERLKTDGFGSSKPIANNDTEEGRKQNRRVELKFSGVTNETHVIYLENGTQLKAQFIMINKDGSIGYKETLKSPMKKLKAPEIKNIQFHNGSQLVPQQDALVKRKIEQAKQNTLREEASFPPVKETQPSVTDLPLSPSSAPQKRTSLFIGFGGYPVNVKVSGIISASYANTSGSLPTVSTDIKKQNVGYGGLVGIEWGTDRPIYTRAAFQYAVNSSSDRILWTFGIGKGFGKDKKFKIGIDVSTGYVQTSIGRAANTGITINSANFKADQVNIIVRNAMWIVTPNISYDFIMTKTGNAFRLNAGFSTSGIRALRMKFKVTGAEKNSTFLPQDDSGVTFKLDGVKQPDLQIFDIFGPHASIIYLIR